MTLQADEGIPSTAEGLYSSSFPVPLLCDPGHYNLPVHATDTADHAGTSFLLLDVEYKRPDYPPDIFAPENQAVLDRTSSAVLLSGNRIEALVSGKSAMDRRMSMIREAREQINLEVYCLTAEGLCGQLVDAMLKKAAEGVEVNMILNMSSQLVVSPITTLRVGLDKIGKDIQMVAKRIEEVFEGQRGFLETLKEIQESFQGFGQGKHGVNVILVGEVAILGPEKKGGILGKRSQKWFEQMEKDRQQIGKRDAKWLHGLSPSGGMRNINLPSLPLLTYAIHEKIMVVDGIRAIVGGGTWKTDTLRTGMTSIFFWKGLWSVKSRAGSSGAGKLFPKTSGRRWFLPR